VVFELRQGSRYGAHCALHIVNSVGGLGSCGVQDSARGTLKILEHITL
jgi:hypothetical protein